VVPRVLDPDRSLILPFKAMTDTIRNTIEELRIIAAQYAATNKAAQPLPAPSDCGEASSDVAIQDAEEGAKGSRKRCKHLHQEATIVADSDGGNSKQAGSAGVVHSAAAAGSGKHQAWPPTDHIEKLLEETCPNHAYPVKHKLSDCDMMKNFMASGSLTRGMEVDEVPNAGDAMPCPREDVVMTIYVGHPSPGVRHVSNPSPRTPTRCGWRRRDVGM
jgi:uncharacterized phage infection (PIP) family protein YhgE